MQVDVIKALLILIMVPIFVVLFLALGACLVKIQFVYINWIAPKLGMTFWEYAFLSLSVGHGLMATTRSRS